MNFQPNLNLSPTILGAIAGDVLGSIYEHDNIKTTDFELLDPNCRFTDDSILTIAIADSLLHNKNMAQKIWEYGNEYPNYGFGRKFREWLESDHMEPYHSFGNGSAMRVSPIGFFYTDIESVLKAAKESAEVTHNHPEGIIGAQAVASAIYFARIGKSKDFIRNYISTNFHYNMNFTLDKIRETYTFDVSCQGSVPQSIQAFLESSDFESAIRLAISIGGDSDTIASIAGAIAAAFYKDIPTYIKEFVIKRIPHDFVEIINEFDQKVNSQTI